MKKYWNNQPCNIKHSNKEIGTKEYFEEISARKYKVESHIFEFDDFKKMTSRSWSGITSLYAIMRKDTCLG